MESETVEHAGERKTREMQLDEMADFHARLSGCESNDIRLSRRITDLENAARGHHNDDPLGGMGSLLWIMAALTLLPVVLDMVKTWRSSPSV
jgi:hypothetical protein